MLPDFPLATLALADGSLFYGYAIGDTQSTIGEVVFNTSLTGYQEILTDPSYANQIITLTYPHIGNTGINLEDIESNKIYASGLIIKNIPTIYSNYRASDNLVDYLKKHKIVAIAGIDTRKLTKILRTKGAQNGAIVIGHNVDEQAIELAKSFQGLDGLDLAKEVSSKEVYNWNQIEWNLNKGYQNTTDYKYHVVVYDFGVKNNILRMLAQRGCKLTVVPAQTPFEDIVKLNSDGVFLSNGPGDPAACDYAINATKNILSNNNKKIPVFGICLGHQILALACGAKTIKMKFGHHGANHPVQEIETSKVFITSQNHGFAVDETTLPKNIKVTYKSLFDSSLQGIELLDYPAFGFQGHPEASPGPHDLAHIFDYFIELMNK